MFQLDLEKVEEPEIKLPTSAGSQKKQEHSRKASTSASLTTLKSFDCVDHYKLWKFLKEMGIPDQPTCFLRSLYADFSRSYSQNQKWNKTGSKLGNKYIKAVYCHPAHLTYMQSTSCEMPAWMKQAGIKIVRRNINNLRYADDTTLMAES